MPINVCQIHKLLEFKSPKKTNSLHNDAKRLACGKMIDRNQFGKMIDKITSISANKKVHDKPVEAKSHKHLSSKFFLSLSKILQNHQAYFFSLFLIFS